jgi:hypothetical protein
MADRVGIISSRAADEADRFRVLLPDGAVELVEAGLDDAVIMARFDLDRVVHAPHVDFCEATHLDGPLAGSSGYAVNRVGHRVGFALPPRPGGLTGEYEVVKLSEGGRPAELRFVEQSEA